MALYLKMASFFNFFVCYFSIKEKEYPQVRKTGVDAVHEKLPTEGLYHEENVICNACNDD